MAEWIVKAETLADMEAGRFTVSEKIVRCMDCQHWREQGLCGIWDHYIDNGKFYCECGLERGEAE